MNIFLFVLGLLCAEPQAAENTDISTATAAAAPAKAAPKKAASAQDKIPTEQLIMQKSAELLEKIKGKRPSGPAKKAPKKLPTEKEVLQYCKDMESGGYDARKAAFYKIYPLRISFTEGWFKFPADSKAKAALIRLLSRELDYQNPPPSVPRRPCRGDGCSRYLMDSLTAVASIRNEHVLPVLLKSYSGLAGFGGFVHLAVTQQGDAAFPQLKALYERSRGEIKDRALFSLLALLKGGGWYGDVRVSPATTAAISAIAKKELQAPTTAENLRRKAIATRLLRTSDINLELTMLATAAYKDDAAVRNECNQSYIAGGIIDKELLRYLRMEATGDKAAATPAAQPAPEKKEEKK